MRIEYLTPHKRRAIYVVLEDLDFVWDEADIPKVEEMWREGLSVWEIAKVFDRDPDEVALLIMDRARQGTIRKRKWGAYARGRRAKRTRRKKQ